MPPCERGKPKATDTVAFEADGYAWALDPGGANLTCLFPVEAGGQFAWGPLGDRVLLDGLEVHGVAGGPSLAASDQTFDAITWSRPTGTSIVFAPSAAGTLKKAHLDGSGTQDVTPVPSARYVSVVYHPSGQAFAVVVDGKDGQSIWLSSNTGKNAGRLVFAVGGTKFRAIGFDADGKHLLYGALHADDHAELHSIDVTDPSKAPVVWEGRVGGAILDLQPGLTAGTVAWTLGASCDESVAMAHTATGTIKALPQVDGPTRSVGWLSATALLVAAGGCHGPLDLSAVDLVSGSIAPVAYGVDAAAVRTPVPKPAAALPKGAVTQGSGFG